MPKPEEPIVIRKHPNRRLYSTGTSTYMTLEHLAGMVRQGENFVVYDAKSGEDIARSSATQTVTTIVEH
jgi:polyhydroxyalkanoate synthesis repressor PhaR